MRGKSVFRESDVTRAIRAAVKAGIEVARVEIDTTGKIVVVAGTPEQASNELDQWIDKHNAH